MSMASGWLEEPAPLDSSVAVAFDMNSSCMDQLKLTLLLKDLDTEWP
ncbi:MAG: hypothetical protein CM15mP77_2700 [Synechococcus sp.]|nr:MAG: hypothetical protein CM15mP77_2700 [Synechococcus sp.]